MTSEVIDRVAAPGSGDCGRGYACQFCADENGCALDKPGHERRLLMRRIEVIDQFILVMANKGGVGKSSVAVNLATTLTQQGRRVGLADADVHGPNVGQLCGLQGVRHRVNDAGISPPICAVDSLPAPGLKVGSLGFFLPDDDTPVVWRDPYKFDFIHHLIGSYNWGALDYLVIDLPPGTGNELITLCDLLEGANLAAVLVTTSDTVALLDCMKAERFCRERGVPLLGIIENMGAMACPHCGEDIELFDSDRVAQARNRAGLADLGRIPLSPAMIRATNQGLPVVLLEPAGIPAQCFARLARVVTDQMGKRKM
jgi:ATP-binding protein involved in chromosome partitioning